MNPPEVTAFWRDDQHVLEWQLAEVEIPSADEGIEVIPVDTVRPDALDWMLRDIGTVPPRPSNQST